MIKQNYIKVFSPATIANVACGFDIFGIALDNPGDEVEISVNLNSKEIKIVEITGDNGLLPYDVDKNTVTISLIEFMKYLNIDIGLDIKIHKKMPFGSGLGSSAASSVAGVFAFNQMLVNSLPKDMLLPFVVEGEKAVSGSMHADNVAAALFGGFIVVKKYPQLKILKVDVKNQYFFSVIHPEVEVKTDDARKILRKDVKLEYAINQWGNIAATIIALQTGNNNLLKESLIDVIVEPVRSIFIPEFYNLKDIAYKNNAISCSISGSGPSVFGIFESEEMAKKTLEEQQNLLKSCGIGSDVYLANLNSEGPKVIG
ncbi:MAG TPA: homoserine kinase [Ignavibacteriales bacterium]|nr:homoserine kinase [Ignavibacteriales bacterium]HOL82335.1 homoserine kinase [Ignavibacteriales bacterium]HOM66368.1 homoserine kinase [Ignavibacteriales bacterium]HPP34531.1 homoserine kinase [Ignavibacteriales bacterium]HRR19693.1 homoserine kinase [Ignavibacteriales bacterium]